MARFSWESAWADADPIQAPINRIGTRRCTINSGADSNHRVKLAESHHAHTVPISKYPFATWIVGMSSLANQYGFGLDPERYNEPFLASGIVSIGAASLAADCSECFGASLPCDID
jgi:hypothetical protein